MTREFIDFDFIISKNSEVKDHTEHIKFDGVTHTRAVALEQSQRDAGRRINTLYNQTTGYARLTSLKKLLEQNPDAVWEEGYPSPDAKRQKIKVRVGLRVIAWL